MKLSEAMRKGSKVMRQKFGDWTDGNGGGCALTMTTVGAGLVPQNADTMRQLYATHGLMNIFTVLQEKGVVPCGCGHSIANFHAIIHLNDRHHWSAERIAGWIESHLEVPIYSMLEIQEFIGEPVKEEVPCVR